MAANVRSGSERKSFMSANSIDRLTAYDLTTLPEVELGQRPERRSRVRLHVHWRVFFFRTEPPEVVECITQNLTSKGFYCLSKVAFPVGENLSCNIRFPAYDPGKEMDRQLDCKVRVTRVEANVADGLFGIACCLEDYQVARTLEPRRHQ